MCHTSAPNLNPYGAAYKAAGRNTAAFALIENLDSDGDGFTNLQEINALTFPGDSLSHPVLPTATKTATPTNTALPPTATPTKVPPTATATPTKTAVPPTATFTSVPPTAVPPTATFTSLPPTATNTSVPPTSVPPTATLTSVPPTGVPPTATNTSMPPTATFTALPPTAVPPSMTPVASPTPVTPPPAGAFNLRIIYFSATDEVKLGEPKPIRFWLVVKNMSQVQGQATATLTGVQNGVEFYRQAITVSDPVGGGYTSFKFPDAQALVEGKIIWTVTMVDNTDTEVRTQTTKVEGRETDDHHGDDHKLTPKYHRTEH
jgi:hypothetical protein